MSSRVMPSLLAAAALLSALALLAGAAGAPETKSAASAAPATDKTSSKATPARARDYTTETVRGRVVWLDEALARSYGVATEADAAHTAVALETAAGDLLPIVPDTRGRAFAVDQRLRNVDVELLVRRYGGVPMIQVIRLYFVKPGGRYQVDYWCDICAIPMFILKDCECCQGPTRIRERKVLADGRLEE